MDSREKGSMRNIPHAVIMREYGTSRCLNQLASEFRVVAEEHLVMKEYSEMKCDLPHFTRSTYLMVFSPDGKKMASSHGNHNVYVTDVKTGRNLNTLTGHPRTPWCIAFHPSSNQILASGCLGGQVRVWDLHGGSEIWTIEGQTSIASLAFHPSERLLVIASYNEIYFWDWSQPEPFTKCNTLNEKEKIRYVAFDYTGSKLVTGIEIPKPLQSQWDRVGTGGQSNRSVGPLGTRPSGQRSGFGTVFSRLGQSPGSVAGSGPTNGPTPARSPSSSSPLSSISPSHLSSSNLDGRIRTNGQILQMLLDPRRQVHRTQMIRRLITRYTNSMSNTVELHSTTQDRNIFNLQNASNTGNPIAMSTSSGLTSLPANAIFGTTSFDQWFQAHAGSSPTSRNGGESSPSSLNTSNSRNLTSEISSTISSTLLSDSSRNVSDISGSVHAACSRSHLTERIMSTSASSSQEQGGSFPNADLTSGASNSGEPSASSTTSADVGSLGTSGRQIPSSVLLFNNLYIKNFSSRLLQEIQRNIAILIVQLSSIQYCSVCSPPMNSSQLCHIQQLWLELRDQIRPLQTSVWENINLNATAWHTSASQAASDMINQWEHGLQYQPQYNSSMGSNSAPQTNTSSASSSQPDEVPITSSACSSCTQQATNVPPTILPTEQSTSSSTSKFNDSNSSTFVSGNIVPARKLTSTETPGPNNLRPNLRLGQRGNVHRIHRSNHMRKTLYLKCQSALGRRFGNTAGALRAQRSTHARQAQTTGNPVTETSERSHSSSNQPLGQGIHLSPRPSAFTQPEGARESGDRSEQMVQRTNNDTLSPRAHNTSVRDDENIDSPQSQLLKYRLLLGRRRNTPRISRNLVGRGSYHPEAQRVTPPRYFGGRRSVFEVTLDPGTSRSSEQPSSNSRTSSQAPVRTSDNMLMRIFRSLRRAATLSGRSERPLSQDAGTAESVDHPQHVLAVPVQSRQFGESSLLSNQAQDISPDQSNETREPPSLPLWTQTNEPEGDILDNHDPQLDTVDPVVQETLASIQPSGSMNIVQDGVMTEDLARNLLRLHLHQQHQELQLRQHQARLRVRLQNQNVSQSAGQPQSDQPRRLAQCSVCGGSIFISSHILLRMDTPSEEPPSTQVSSQTNTTPPVSGAPSDSSSSVSSPSICPSSIVSSFSGQGRRRSFQLFQDSTTRPETSENGQTSSSIHILQQPLVAQRFQSSTAQQSHETKAEVIPPILQGASLSPSSPEPLPSPSLFAKPVSSQLPPSSSPLPISDRQRIQAFPLRNCSGLEANPAQENPSSAQHLRSDDDRQHAHLQGDKKSSASGHQESESQPTSTSPRVLACTSNGNDSCTDLSEGFDSSTISDMPSTSAGIRVTGKSKKTDSSFRDVCSKSHLEGTAIDDSSSSDSETEGIMRHLRKRRASQSSILKDSEKYKGRRKVDKDRVDQLPPNSNPLTEAGPSQYSDSKKDDTSKLSAAREGIATEAASLSSNSFGHMSTRMPSTNESRKEEDDLSQPSSSRHDVRPSFASLGVPFLNLLPDPTFTQQLETVTSRLDNLMSLQRNALNSARRSQRSPPPETSPLRNPGYTFPVGHEINNGKIDALTSANQLLHRILETMSHQILMVQNFRSHQGGCSEHQNSTPPGLMNSRAQPNLSSFVSNVRRRGQELLRLMAETLSTFSSHSHIPAGVPEQNQRDPPLYHMQTLSSAYWLLQGLYILIHVGLELSDLLLTFFISCYEPNDSVDNSTASLHQPCVCFNSNTTSTSPVSRPPVASTQLWNGQSISATARDLLPLMFESLRSQFRFPFQSQFSNNVNNTSASNNESSSPPGISAVRRPWLVNLHNVLASARLQQGPFRPHPVSESNVRPRQNQQSEVSPTVQIPVISVPSHIPQVNSETPVESRIRQPTSATYALVHPVVSSTIRRNISQVPYTSTSQSQENNNQAQASVMSGYSRPGFMRLRSRLLHPPVHQQDQPSASADADLAAHQSLFFHFDYTRNIGHIVREPNFTTEEHRVHRIQLWNFSKGDIPVITDGCLNIVVSECKIHNDASVDISADGHLLVALLPPLRTTANPYIPTPPPGQTVGVYSLVWESLGQLLYTTSLDRPAVSVALSPTAAYLLVGLATRRSILMPTEQHAIAQAFRLEGAKPGRPIGARGRLNLHRHIEAQNAPLGINCIRWAPVSGHGMVYGTNTGALVMLQ